MTQARDEEYEQATTRKTLVSESNIRLERGIVMYIVIDTPMFPNRYKVHDPRWPGANNGTGEYFPTRAAAQREADRRNRLRQGSTCCDRVAALSTTVSVRGVDF